MQGANWVPTLMRGILSKPMTVRGFIVSDFFPRYNEFAAEIVGWVKSGKLKCREDIVDGLENAAAGDRPSHGKDYSLALGVDSNLLAYENWPKHAGFVTQSLDNYLR